MNNKFSGKTKDLLIERVELFYKQDRPFYGLFFLCDNKKFKIFKKSIYKHMFMLYNALIKEVLYESEQIRNNFKSI